MIKGILQASVSPSSLPVLRQIVRRHPCGVDPHITMVYGALKDDFEDFLGEEFQCTVLGEYWNDYIQAVMIDLPLFLNRHCQNVYPHITLSMTSATSAVEANGMLVGRNSYEEHYPAIVLDCYINFVEWK